MSEGEPTCRIFQSFLLPYKFIVRLQERYLTSLIPFLIPNIRIWDSMSPYSNTHLCLCQLEFWLLVMQSLREPNCGKGRGKADFRGAWLIRTLIVSHLCFLCVGCRNQLLREAREAAPDSSEAHVQNTLRLWGKRMPLSQNPFLRSRRRTLISQASSVYLLCGQRIESLTRERVSHRHGHPRIVLKQSATPICDHCRL